MKKIIVLMAACIFTLSIMAQDDKNINTGRQYEAVIKYCAKMTDGIIVMMQDQKVLASDVKLENGVVIKSNGTVINIDGTQILLKSGDCVDNKGNLIKPGSPDKLTKQDDKIPPK